MPSTLLSAADILKAADLEHEDVDVPEWGGVVRMQQMNAEESVAFSTELDAMPKGDNVGMYLMLVYSARNSEGERIFKSSDVPALKKKNIDALNRLQHIGLRINKMTPASKAELKNASGVALTDATPTA